VARGDRHETTDEELRIAFEEYRRGTFVKHDASGRT